jgi:hypothetical protein
VYRALPLLYYLICKADVQLTSFKPFLSCNSSLLHDSSEKVNADIASMRIWNGKNKPFFRKESFTKETSFLF